MGLTEWERIVYGELCAAARERRVCPNYLDLNEMIGCESSSTSSTIVKRLEAKGLIRVIRFQRFREVQIIATGEWTMRSPCQHTTAPHAPRRKPSMPAPATDRKPYKTRVG